MLNPPLATGSGDVLRSMRPNVASGPDGISSPVLRACSSSICTPLARLFNRSLSTGKVPDDWKLSHVVTPIHKSGDQRLVLNYRPISLLSLTSKVLERVIHNALMEHMLDNHLLSNRQFGFLPASSTQEALLTATKDWHEMLERRSNVMCVFLDLSKASNSLPHSLVLESLSRVGVVGELHKSACSS